jgi:hypothetical protein
MSLSIALADQVEFTEFSKCGDYLVSGIIKLEAEKLQFNFIVFQGSKSEIKIKVAEADISRIAAYVNKSSIIKAQFIHPITNQLGEFKILDIQSKIADPLKGAKDSGFHLVKETACKLN